MFPIRKILAPIDFEQAESPSLDYAVRLAEQLGAAVCVAHVYPIPMYSFPDGAIITSADLAARISETAQKNLDAAVQSRKGRGVELNSVLANGNAWEEIGRIAKEQAADLVVMGTHARRGVARALLGSVAEQVLRTSAVPVLIVHGPQST